MVHKYMNTELHLYSVSRKRKENYEHGTAHKVFENKLNQDFSADEINQKWCTDFTYLFLTEGNRFPAGIDPCKLLIHSDQESQYTSKDYAEFCESLGITQSMSKVGYPYDNAPMERYFNTLKNDLINQHYYHTKEELYTAVEEFAYVHYNLMYVRILIIITKRLLRRDTG